MQEKTCRVEGCNRKIFARGLCSWHYYKERTKRINQEHPFGICRVNSCQNAAIQGNGYCRKHGLRLLRHGSPEGGGDYRNPDAICAAIGCNNIVKGGGKGFCRYHYWRLKEKGDIYWQPVYKKDQKCLVDGCTHLVGDKGSHGMCCAHAAKEWRKTHQRTPITKHCDIEECTNLAISNRARYCASHHQQMKQYNEIRRKKIIHPTNRIHNPLYKIWNAMKQRCSNPNNKAYKNYGGRGVKVDERWLGAEGFDNFVKDMGERPSAEYSLDRIDVNGNYSPKNCKWSTRHEQNINRRDSKQLYCIRRNSRGGKYVVTLKRKGFQNIRKSFYQLKDAVEYRDRMVKELWSK